MGTFWVFFQRMLSGQRTLSPKTGHRRAGGDIGRPGLTKDYYPGKRGGEGAGGKEGEGIGTGRCGPWVEGVPPVTPSARLTLGSLEAGGRLLLPRDREKSCRFILREHKAAGCSARALTFISGSEGRNTSRRFETGSKR